MILMKINEANAQNECSKSQNDKGNGNDNQDLMSGMNMYKLN